jgi:ribosome-binding protein aMBF1 (putative translation factor)
MHTSNSSVEYIDDPAELSIGSRTESAEVFQFSVPATPDALPKRVRPVSERMAALERDPVRAALLAEARKELAAELQEEQGETIRSLRLAKGLSQSALAEMIGTKQPHVARIEAGQDIFMSTAKKLAAALGLDMNALDDALQLQDQVKAAARCKNVQV